MQQVGFKPQKILIAGSANEIEGVLHPPSEFLYSARIGILWGLVAGVMVGLAQAAFIGPAVLDSWSRLAVIVAWCAFGWAIFGGIVGGSGVLSPGRVSPETEHELQQDVAKSRILLCAQSQTVADEAAMQEALAAAGATHICCRITPAA
jgi:hypothetical protein